MKQTTFGTNTALGMVQVAAMLLTAPLSRLWFNRWGATAEECKRALPGDDLVPTPRIASTRGITIQAPPVAVWPWLVQMGQGRSGLYSYDGLENLIGCDIHSADRIAPEFQSLEVGDPVLFGPAEKQFPGQVVLETQPERALVMCALNPATREPETSATWVFVLEEQEGGATRLLVRSRNGYEPTAANHIVWHLVEPISFVMERKMLLGIKARAEQARIGG